MAGVMDDLAIGFVHGPRWDAYFGLSLVRIARELDISKWISYPSGPTIDIGRNTIVDLFLESDKDYLFMVDTDMTFSPQMLHSLHEKRNPDWVLSALCYTESGTPVPKVHATDDEGNEGFKVISVNPEKPLVEVAMCGAAFTIVHRGIYEKVGANYAHSSRPYYAFTERYPRAGEDAEFCARAAESGFKTVVDCTVVPGHRKVKTIGNTSVPD